MDHLVPPQALLLGAAPRSFRRHGEDFGGSSARLSSAMAGRHNTANLHSATCMTCCCLPLPRSAWRADPSKWTRCRCEQRDKKINQMMPGKRRLPLNGQV